MNVLIATKVVVQDQDIVVKADGMLDTSKASFRINPFDLNAIQAGVDLKQTNPDIMLKGFSLGGKELENAKLRKDILSRGLDELIIACDDNFTNLLANDSSKLLASMIKDESFDLIICGEASADKMQKLCGLQLGFNLNLPCINAVSKIVELNSSSITVQRSLENEVQTLKLPLPALICVSSDINTPSIPGMKAILAASKKKVVKKEISLKAKDENLTSISILAPKQKERKHNIIKSDSDEDIALFAQELEKLL